MVETWKVAAEWLCEVGVINKLSITKDTFTLDFFMIALRDGEILINLLNKLIDTPLKPLTCQGSHFSMQRNIENFLSVASQSFQLTPDELFTFNDLCNFAGIEKILNTLSLISYHPKAIVRGYNPFSNNEFLIESEYDNLNDKMESSIYNTEYEMINELKNTGVDEENTYNCILNVANAVPYEELKMFEPKTTFDYIVQELVETENNFLNSLEVLLKIKERLCLYLDEAITNMIFCQLEKLVDLHRNLLTMFLAELKQKELFLGPIIKKFKAEFLCYSEYCLNLEAAQLKTKELLLDIRYSDILKQIMQELGCKQDLDSYLILPFQRVLRYALIYERLESHMSPTCQDKQDLAEAIRILKNLSDHINQTKKDNEHIAMIAMMEKNIKKDSNSCEMPKLEELGHRLKDGIMKVTFNIGAKKANKCHVFLFDTRLIVLKNIDNFYYPRACIDLMYYKIFILTIKEKNDIGWLMQQNDESVLDTITFKVKNKLEVPVWISEIISCFQKRKKISSYKQHCYLLNTFPIASHCTYCGLLLRGSVAQGYICTACTGMFHEECLTLAIPCTNPKINQLLHTRSLLSSSFGNVNRNRSLSQNSLVPNSRQKWFDPCLNRQKAEELLLKGIDGSFIIRGSSELIDDAPYVLSFLYDRKIKHMKIHLVDQFYYVCQTKIFDSLDTLVFYYQTHSMREVIKTIPAMLRIPAKGPLYNVQASRNYQNIDDSELCFVKGDQFQVLNETNDQFLVMNSVGMCGLVPKSKVQKTRK